MPTNSYATTAGTKIYYDTLGTANPITAGTLLAGVDDINGMPMQEADEFETTRVDQEVSAGVHDWFKQFAPDHVDPGTMELKLGMDDAQLSALYALVRQFKTWAISFSDGSRLVFDGFVKKVGPEAQKGDEMVVAVSIRCSGTPAYTQAA